jgi:sortase A
MTSTRELEQMRTPAGALRTADAHTPSSAPAGSLVGRIEVPRLNLSAIVREGDDVATLRKAVGHIPGTAMPGDTGNAALAGHRDTFFRALRDVRAGDRIVMTTPDAVFHYVVRGTEIVDPADVSVLSPTRERTLTLVTCYPFNYIGSAPRRFIVRAQLAGGV